MKEKDKNEILENFRIRIKNEYSIEFSEAKIQVKKIAIFTFKRNLKYQHMKIFDCFMYFDEEMILDLRLNILDKFVDYFIIVESSFTHRGDKRSLKFNPKKFEKFRDKIIYLTYDDYPENIEKIFEKDSE